MLFDFADILARLAVVHHRAARYFDDLVFSVLAERAALSAFAAIGCHDMLLVLEVQQRPEVTVATQDDRPAFTAITAVGTSLGQVFGSVQVHTARAALTGAAINLHIVDKIGSHKFMYDVRLMYNSYLRPIAPSMMRMICRKTSAIVWFPFTAK